MKLHTVENIAYLNDEMLITIDGKEHRIHLNKISKKLLSASAVEREKYEISPSGYGIHWALLDEDISIDALIGIKHATPSFKTTKKTA